MGKEKGGRKEKGGYFPRDTQIWGQDTLTESRGSKRVETAMGRRPLSLFIDLK